MRGALKYFTGAVILIALLFAAPGPVCTASGAAFTDATGRTLQIPAAPVRVVPAGPPAAVLLAVLAPDLMAGWPRKPGPESSTFLPDQVAALPQLPPLTDDAAVQALKDMHADLVLDYGDVSQRYVDRIKLIQDNTGVPAILIDGTLAKAPAAFRQAGTVLGRSDRAEALAELAEDLFASVPPKPDKPVRVLVLRPGDTPMAAQPGTPATEVVSMLG